MAGLPQASAQCLSYLEKCGWRPIGGSAATSAAYAIANPPKAFAVRYAKDWPGAKTLPSDVGRRVIRVKRPGRFSP